MALKSGKQTYQILTNDDEVCIPSLFSVFLAVYHSQAFGYLLRGFSILMYSDISQKVDFLISNTHSNSGLYSNFWPCAVQIDQNKFETLLLEYLTIRYHCADDVCRTHFPEDLN